MADSQDPRDGQEEEFHDSNLRDIIQAETPSLLKIAAARIERTCSDPANHKKDVVQQGIKKVLQALRNRPAGYEDTAAVLRAAVWQEGVRHSLTCPRELAVDFNESYGCESESDAANPLGHSKPASFDPRELYIEMLDLEERRSRVTDKDLFDKYFVEGWTMAEIAEERNCSIMTVQRGVRKLVNELRNV
jgi:DNA-binding NarL/FixJ family response regulator